MAKTFTQEQVASLLWETCQAAGSQRQWAIANNVDPPRISEVLSGREPPGPPILRALGLRREVVYRPVEHGRRQGR